MIINMDNCMDLISVIVPVYNTEKFLQRCVNSILNQSYSNLEIILVDDGSKETAARLCDELAEKDKRIKVVHKKNGGLSSARNCGIETAIGKYISFIDSDDFIDENMLWRLYENLKKYDADLSMVKYAEVSNDDTLEQIEKTVHVYEGKDVEKSFLELKIDSVCVGLYKRELIGDTRFIFGKTSEDIPFNFMIFQKTKKFVYIPEDRYYYYYNPNSISNGKLDRNMFNYLEFRKNIYDFYEKSNDEELLRIAEALYARAAMGLQTRMALYGLENDLNEKVCKNQFSRVFKEHKNAYFLEKTIPFSRKIIAIAVFGFYPIIKLIGKIKK